MKLSAMEPHIPRDGVTTNNGLLIQEAGDNCGDDVASAADVAGDGRGLDEDDSLGPDVLALLDLR